MTGDSFGRTRPIREGVLPRLAECRDCAEPIRFVQMLSSGRNMPVNPQPTKDARYGSVAASLRAGGLIGYVISADRREGDPRYPYRFTPHYVTCEAKKKATPPIPAPDAPLF